MDEKTDVLEDDETDAEYLPGETQGVKYLARNTQKRYRENTAIWMFFKRLEPTSQKLARCNTCHGVKSYKTTTTNLKNHLGKHPEAMEKYMKYKNREIPMPDNGNHRTVDDEYLTIEPYKLRPKDQAIWKYFVRMGPLTDRIAKCNTCNQVRSFRTSITNLRTHLYLKHPDIVEQDDELKERKNSLDDTDSDISSSSNPKIKFLKKADFSKHFDINTSKRLANCKLCNQDVHFSTEATLRYHTLKIHGNELKLSEEDEIKDGNDEDDEKMEDDSEQTEKKNQNQGRRSENWKYFEVVDGGQKIARCNICSRELSYSTISNLKKHLLRIHGDMKFFSGYSDVFAKIKEITKQRTPIKIKRKNRFRSNVWKYFDPTDEEEKMATCKICSKLLCYKAVSNLKKHVLRQHGGMSSDEEGEAEVIEEQSSPVWAYFKCLSVEQKLASCLICKKRIEYETPRDLNKHLTRKHPQKKAELEVNNKSKKIIVAGNGDIYEIDEDVVKAEPASDKEADDHDSDAWPYNNEIDALTTEEYLDEKLFEEPIKIPAKKRRVAVQNPVKTEEPLDLFGKYMVSLLKKLPKHKSDKLQTDFIKQIMDAQHTDDTRPENTRVSDTSGMSIRNTRVRSIDDNVTSNSNGQHINEIVVGND